MVAGVDLGGTGDVGTVESCETGLITLAEGLRNAVVGLVSASCAAELRGSAEACVLLDELAGPVALWLTAGARDGCCAGFEGVAPIADSEVEREGCWDGLELPRPSEYPKPKNTPQISTRPKKTPSRDFIPRVISVSVCSCSSGSWMDLIILSNPLAWLLWRRRRRRRRWAYRRGKSSQQGHQLQWKWEDHRGVFFRTDIGKCLQVFQLQGDRLLGQ